MTDANGHYTFLGLDPRHVYPPRAHLPRRRHATPARRAGVVRSRAARWPTRPTSASCHAADPAADPQPAPFGTTTPTSRPPRSSASTTSSSAAPPTPPGGAAAVAYLKGGGSLRTLAADLLGSLEYETGVVASYYVNFLGRAGSGSEVAGWVAAMQGGLSEEHVEVEFLDLDGIRRCSTRRRRPSSSRSTTTSSPAGTKAEVTPWVSLLASVATDAGIIRAFLQSTEATTRALNDLYLTILGGQSDGNGARTSRPSSPAGRSRASPPPSPARPPSSTWRTGRSADGGLARP